MSAAVISRDGRFSAMTFAKSVTTEETDCISAGALSTIEPISPVKICKPVSNSVGSAPSSESARVVMMSAAIGMSRGRLALMASMMAVRIWPPVSTSAGIISVMAVEILLMPSVISAVPLSLSPPKIAVRPSMMAVMPGMKSAIRLFFMPSVDCCRFCRESWNAAEALTSSSLITMPRSWACRFMASISSALVFSSGPSSAAPLPNSSVASRLRSVSSSTPCSAVTVLLNRSSRDMLATSFWEMPSLPKASEPSSAALDSLIIGVRSASMLLPECWSMKSHS